MTIMELIDAYAGHKYVNGAEGRGPHEQEVRTEFARAAVQEAVEKLEKDAARYQWLRDKSDAVYLKEGPDSHGWLPSDGEAIDEAADKAMEATNGQGN